MPAVPLRHGGGLGALNRWGLHHGCVPRAIPPPDVGPYRHLHATAPTAHFALAGQFASDRKLTMEPFLPPIKETSMGKYFIAWLLGVPAFVLVLIYLLF
jgi:hypothetical protein